MLHGDECLTWEALDRYEDPITGEVKDYDHLVLHSVSLIKSKDVLIKKDKYGIEPSEMEIELE